MTEPTVAMAGTTPIGCSCPEYQRRSKAYRWPHPCDHMTAVSRAQPYVAPPDPNRMRVDAAPFYAATYETTIAGVRYVGDVDDAGCVRFTSVERSGFAADYPLDALGDDALSAAREALAGQARAMSARGEVDILSLPSAWTWRETATSRLAQSMSPRDRRAQAELQALRDSEAARAVAIAARCAESEAA